MPAPPTAPPTSLYVHVPFCVVKCGYCDFTSYVPDGDAALDLFLEGLRRELELVALPAAPTSVFIGGGTPSFLDLGRLRRLFATLGEHVDLARCREVTMEANPESMTAAKAAVAREAGVNRLSIGVQSFAAHRLAFLDRAHDAAGTRAAYAAAREGGFANVSLDLMFGLPGQDAPEWERDLDEALALDPDHLSCYGLTFEPGTRLTRDLRQGIVTANDADIDRDLLLRTRARLAREGFHAYEISNFAGRGGPCEHNDHYWLQGDYAGVGPGAASHRQGVRWTNLKALDAWGEALRRGLPPVAEAETLTREQRLREALWLGIRRADGVDLDGAAQRLGLAVPAAVAQALAASTDEGLVNVDAGQVRLTEAGLPLADRVGERFLCASDDP
ncbi:MAG: radical SAM family heme chaperone HemW [Planctomycetota bacterium]